MNSENLSSSAPTGNSETYKNDVIGFLPMDLSFWEWIKFSLNFVATYIALLPPLALANCCQVLSVLVKPFSPILFRRINYWLAGAWWYILVHYTKKVQGVKLVKTGDEIPYGEQAIVVCNHQTMPDIPVLLYLAEKAGCVGGMRFFVKYMLRYMPFIGWGMLFLDMIFVKRAWQKDREFILRMFANLRTYTLPIWIINYSEGTRSTPKKLERSREYARKAGLPVLKNVMLPRPKGFVETFNHMHDKFHYVYDVTIAYTRARPRLSDLCGARMREVHCHVRCYKTADLPKSDAELSQWLIDRFVEKDAMMENFAKSGKFLSNSLQN